MRERQIPTENMLLRRPLGAGTVEETHVGYLPRELARYKNDNPKPGEPVIFDSRGLSAVPPYVLIGGGPLIDERLVKMENGEGSTPIPNSTEEFVVRIGEMARPSERPHEAFADSHDCGPFTDSTGNLLKEI